MIIKGKSPPFMVAVIALIWGALFFLSSDPEKSSAEFVISYGAISLLLSSPFFVFLLMIVKFNLTVDKHVISYRSAFYNHHVKTSDVERVEFQNGYSNIDRRISFLQRLFLPPFRMLFYSKIDKAPLLIVNRAVMSRQGERDLLASLSKHNIFVRR